MQQPSLAELHARLDQCKENLSNPDIIKNPELLAKLNERISGIEAKIAQFITPAPAEQATAPPAKESPAVAAILQSKANKHEKHYRLHLLSLSNEEISSLTGSPKNAVGRDILYYKNGKKSLED